MPRRESRHVPGQRIRKRALALVEKRAYSGGMGQGLLSPGHLIVVLLIVLVVFGPKRLPELGRSLGSGLRGFKAAISDDHPEASPDERPAERTLAPVEPSGVEPSGVEPSAVEPSRAGASAERSPSGD